MEAAQGFPSTQDPWGPPTRGLAPPSLALLPTGCGETGASTRHVPGPRAAGTRSETSPGVALGGRAGPCGGFPPKPSAYSRLASCGHQLQAVAGTRWRGLCPRCPLGVTQDRDGERGRGRVSHRAWGRGCDDRDGQVGVQRGPPSSDLSGGPFVTPVSHPVPLYAGRRDASGGPMSHGPCGRGPARGGSPVAAPCHTGFQRQRGHALIPPRTTLRPSEHPPPDPAALPSKA